MLFGPWLCHSSVDYGSVDAGVNAALNVFFDWRTCHVSWVKIDLLRRANKTR